MDCPHCKEGRRVRKLSEMIKIAGRCNTCAGTGRVLKEEVRLNGLEVDKPPVKQMPMCHKCSNVLQKSVDTDSGGAFVVTGCRASPHIKNYEDARTMCPLLRDQEYEEGPKDAIDAHDIAFVLNEALRLDRERFSRMVTHNFSINRRLATSDFVVSMAWGFAEKNVTHVVSALGLINGLLLGTGKLVAAIPDDRTGMLQGFRVVDSNDPTLGRLSKKGETDGQVQTFDREETSASE